MRGKLKKIFNNKIFMFIFGGVLFSAVSVYAVTYFPSNQVTYDNSSSKLSSTNVQGAIDELYKICQAATSTSSGDYIYFYVNDISESSERGFYRMPINGGAATKIQETTPGYKYTYYYTNAEDFVIYKDYIYFYVNDTAGSGRGFYRISINGGAATKIQETILGYQYTLYAENSPIVIY